MDICDPAWLPGCLAVCPAGWLADNHAGRQANMRGMPGACWLASIPLESLNAGRQACMHAVLVQQPWSNSHCQTTLVQQSWCSSLGSAIQRKISGTSKGHPRETQRKIQGKPKGNPRAHPSEIQGQPAGWLAAWLAGWLADKHAGRQADVRCLPGACWLA